jgi:uncharacterized protein involved in exopolysaccharide biosynthesis
MSTERPPYDEDEIDLMDLLRTLWKERRLIIGMAAAGAVLGLVIGFTSPKQYRVTATFMPEYSTESQGGASSLLRQFGGLAGLGGASYSSGSSALRVELYPDIVKTTPFQKELMYQGFRLPGHDSTITLYAYLTRDQEPGVLSTVLEWTIGLPRKLVALMRPAQPAAPDISILSEQVVSLTRTERGVVQYLEKNVVATLDNRSGIFSISVNMSDPVLAAEVGQYVIAQLTAYLVEYRTEKLKRDLDFTKERLTEARIRYESAGIALSSFRESQQGTATARARRGEQFLQSEHDLAFGVYNTLTQQFEQQQLKLQEETPMFKTLQPVVLPAGPASPKKAQIAVLSTMAFGFLSLLVIFLKKADWGRLTREEGEAGPSRRNDASSQET